MEKVKSCILFFVITVISASAGIQSYERLAERSERLRKDPSVVRYYNFENISDITSPVNDLSGRNASLDFIPATVSDEIIGGLEVIEGRVPGTKAVRIDRGSYRGPSAEIENNVFSFESWFRRSGSSTVHEGLTGSASLLAVCGGGRRGWSVSVGENLSVRISCVPGSTSVRRERSYMAASTRGVAIEQGVWHHVAVTWDGEEIVLFLNGMPVSRVKHDGEYVPAERDLVIGYHTSEIIDIDEVVIYSRVLSPEEIEESAKKEEGFALERAKVLFKKADTLITEGDFEGARKQYGIIGNLAGMDYFREMALFNKAESYRMEGDYSNAVLKLREILSVKETDLNYRVSALFEIARIYSETGQHEKEKEVYYEIKSVPGIQENALFRARMGKGDILLRQREYSEARQTFKNLLSEITGVSNPNEIYRLKLVDRLESIDGLKDGEQLVCERQRRIERINLPEKTFYVAISGADSNGGSIDNPFATIGRAQQEIRRLKSEGRFPEKGVKVYLREGVYFINETISFGREDSGNTNAPVVYRNYPGETARIVGGIRVDNFIPVSEKRILDRLPAEAPGNVIQADLGEMGITDYGQLRNRGTGSSQPGAMELIHNGTAMPLARWPNEGWARVAGLVEPEGVSRNVEYATGRFRYSGDRPETWADEEDIWIRGYLGPRLPYRIVHFNVDSIDTESKIIYVKEDEHRGIMERISAGKPYFVYNVLAEMDMPGEWYLDRSEGIIYFWPPSGDTASENIVTTLDAPIMRFEDASEIIVCGLVLEGTWRNGIEIEGGENNLIAGSVIRNTGQNGVFIRSGWAHGIVGCDIYDTGEGGIILNTRTRYDLRYGGAAERIKKLIPDRMYAENNHIHRVNRLCGSRPAVAVYGIGQRLSHNLIADSNHLGITVAHNNHIIEFNEIHDVLAHSRELGAIYTWDLGSGPLTFRGNIIKNNFLHHISPHSSPNATHGVRALHIDGVSSNLTVSGNVFYRTHGISTAAPDCRYENNIFVDCFPGIAQGNRSNILEVDGKLQDRGRHAVSMWRLINYLQPPWSARYPQLVSNTMDLTLPLGWPENIVIERNISHGGPFVSIAGTLRNGVTLSNNSDRIDPVFFDKENLDFRLRPGSPVYAVTGFEPIPFEKIGLYNDEIRAVWPVKREIGKYFDPEKETKTSAPPEKSVLKASAAIVIDGVLEDKEWQGLDRSKAITLDRYYTPEYNQKSPETLVWVLHDHEYLYIGIKNSDDPWTPDMPPSLENLAPDWGMVEIAIEGGLDAETRLWWSDDMETGPIYIFAGRSDGSLRVLDSYYSMPDGVRHNLEERVRYQAVVLDSDTFKWSAELKVPLASLNLDRSGVESRRFNIGVRRRKNWVAWRHTGGRIWRLEGGGILKFSP